MKDEKVKIICNVQRIKGDHGSKGMIEMMKLLVFLVVVLALNLLLSPLTFHVVGNVPVGAGPSAISFDSLKNEAYIVNSVSDSLSVVDEETNKVVKTIPTGKSPMDIAINQKTGMIYVPVNYNLGNSDLDVLSNDGQLKAVITVGNGPNAVDVNPVTNTIYVTNEGSNDVNVINGSTNQIISTIRTGKGPDAISVDPNTNKVYVANWYDGTLDVIDGKTNRISRVINVGNEPLDIAINLKTDMIYVVNFGSATLSVISGKDDCVVATVSTKGVPWNAAVDESSNMVYITSPSKNAVNVMNGDINRVISVVPVGSNPLGISVNSKTHMVYITNNKNGSVSILDGNVLPIMVVTGVE